MLVGQSREEEEGLWGRVGEGGRREKSHENPAKNAKKSHVGHQYRHNLYEVL